MFENVNRDISIIIYRYKWQSKINSLNKEYLEAININDRDRFLMLSIHGYAMEYNWRHLREFRIFGYYPIFNLHYILIGNLPDRYHYSSTPNLQKLKKSGVKCLTIID